MESKQVIKAKVAALSAQILEILQSSQSLPDPETPRDCILNEIAARQSIFTEVQSQISALKTRQNELLPIHRLPVEIVAIILSMALPLSNYHKRRTTLLLVCRTWTNVINTNPSTFWTTLSTNDPPSQRDRLLQMSRQMPVAIYVNQRYDTSLASRKFLEDIRSKRLTFREVEFTGENGQVMEELLADCLLAPATHLQSLDLHVIGGWAVRNGESNSQNIQMDSVATPNLKSVDLFGVSIPWNAAILRGLRSLSLSYLGRSGANDNPPTIRELVGIVQGCPYLQSLTLLKIILGPDDRREAATEITCSQLITLDISNLSLPSTCDILKCIRYPSTAMVSVRNEDLTSHDGWQVVLGVVLSRLTQNGIIAPIHLEVNRPGLMLSASNFQLKIPTPNEERGDTRSRTTYNELFSSFGAPTWAAVISLHLDALASQNSTAILMAANEFFPNLAKLSIPPYQRLKSKKPWHVVLEKVVQSSQEIQRPTYLCPKLTSLEITAASRDHLDLCSILQLVRTRISGKKSKGKEVEKSPITSISINLESGKLSSEQLGDLNTLKQVTAVHWLSPIQEDPAQNESDDHLEFESSSS